MRFAAERFFLEESLILASAKMPFAQASAKQLSTASGALKIALKSVRFVILAVLLVGELFHFGVPLIPSLSPSLQGWWLPVILNGRSFVEAALGAVVAAILFSWPVLIDEIRAAIQKPFSSHRIWWLLAHIVCAFGVLVWFAFGSFDYSRATGTLWFFCGVVILAASAITWCVALFPLEFWSNWFRRSPGAFAAGAGVGVLTR